jgi:DNA-binding NarL/FixJ family response regulator
MIRLIVCDDHDMVRTGLVRALQSDGKFAVVAEAAGAHQLLALLAQPLAADVLLLDLNLGHAGLAAGIELIGKIGALRPAMAVLVVSMHDDPEVVRSALEAGAKGYVTKDSALSELEEAIRHLHMGSRFLDPHLVESLVAQSRRPKNAPWDAMLTKREREIMTMLCNGQRVSEIALSMGLSIKTISTHKVRLMEKLNLRSNSDLVKLGMRHGI